MAFRLSLHVSTATKCVKCFIEHMLCIVLGVCMHNLRTGPNNKTFYKLTYVHTLAQISTPHCTIISLFSLSAMTSTHQLVHFLPGILYGYLSQQLGSWILGGKEIGLPSNYGNLKWKKHQSCPYESPATPQCSKLYLLSRSRITYS